MSFKTTSYKKNFDLVIKNDCFISEHVGIISEIRIDKNEMPIIAGEFSYSVIDIDLANRHGVNILNLVESHNQQHSFSQLEDVIKNGTFIHNDSKKIILLHTVVINQDYRGLGIMLELMETIYRDYSDAKHTIIALVKPIQDNHMDFQYHRYHNIIKIRTDISDFDSVITMSGYDYYGLNKFENDDETDTELNEYKLFAVAAKCGFERIDDSYLFILDTNIINNIITKKLRQHTK